jgi:hypothetical protein
MAPAGIAVTVEIDVDAPIELAFLTMAPIEPSTIFHAFGPLPAVLGTREQTGDWDHAGARAHGGDARSGGDRPFLAHLPGTGACPRRATGGASWELTCYGVTNVATYGNPR